MSEPTGTALAPAASREVEQIRQMGSAEVARRDEVNKLYKMLNGMEWGSGHQVVKGSSFSPATRQAFAEFCFAARANAMYHVDMLGGKPYLNAQYWSDRINSDERYVDHRLINISNDPDRRAEYGVPEWALAAYVCEIRKLMPFAPLEKIRSGEVLDFERYVARVEEPNWAGNKPKKAKRDGGSYDADPIGNEEATKTARTRALRRTAARAFPVWMAAEEERIKKLENAIQAEFRRIKSEQMDERAALPPQEGPQALRVGAGEPVAAPVPVEVGTREPEPVVVPAARGGGKRLAEAQRKYAEGVEAVLGGGVEDVARFESEELGHDPETLEDFARLNAALERIANSEGDGSQGGFV